MFGSPCGVEAVAAGLRAELALADETLHALGDVEALVAVGLREVFGDVQDGVQAEQVDEVVGPDRDDARGADAGVDLLDRQLLGLLLAPDLGDARVEDPVDDEAGDLGAGDRLLADRLRERDGRADGLGRGLLALDDLDQRHDRGRVEVVEADDLLGAQRRFADLGDRQRGGVRGEDRVAGRGGVELGEHGLLDRDLLRHGLDHEVDVAEVRVGGRAGDAAEHLVDLRLALLLRELALLDELADLPGADAQGLVEAGLHERVVDVLQHHRDPGGRDRLGDLAAHRPGAHDSSLEYEHLIDLLWKGLRLRSRGA